MLEFSQLKNSYPTRLGCTSFIIPADILPNVKLIAPVVDDVELLIFESHRIAPLPTKQVVHELAEIAHTQDLTYTIHMPLDIALASEDETLRKDSVEACVKVFDRMGPLKPFGWVMHLSDLDSENGHQNGSLTQVAKSVKELCQYVTPESLCIETLTDDLSAQESVIRDFGLSVCLDIGHLAVQGYDLDAVWKKWFDRIRVVHLHGVHAEKDHQSLTYQKSEIIEKVFTQEPHKRVTTIEVFGEQKLRDSLRVLHTMKERAS